jgi:Spy/CpxP family protein refolding chaperone
MKIVQLSVPLLIILFTIIETGNAQASYPTDKDQLLKGEAAGQNLVAEQNGYPSPQKIVSLKDQIGLTKDQLKKIKEIVTNLSISAVVKGQEIIDAEEELNKLFASGDVNERTLRIKLERIGKMRAELRFMHLQMYLREKQILTAKQWERLKELKASEVK